MEDDFKNKRLRHPEIATLTRCIWSVTILTYAIRNNEDREIRGWFLHHPKWCTMFPINQNWGLFIGSTADYVYIYIYTYLEYISNKFYELNKCRSIYNAWWTVRRTGLMWQEERKMIFHAGLEWDGFSWFKFQKWLGKSAHEWSQTGWFSYNGQDECGWDRKVDPSFVDFMLIPMKSNSDGCGIVSYHVSAPIHQWIVGIHLTLSMIYDYLHESIWN